MRAIHWHEARVLPSDAGGASGLESLKPPLLHQLLGLIWPVDYKEGDH
jgi:hypothetical protein